MTKFKLYLKNLNFFKGILSKGAIIAPPTAAGFSVIGPPWPTATVVVGFFISVFELIAVMYVFNLGPKIKDNLDHLIKRSVIIIVVAFIIYLTAFCFLTRSMEAESHRDVIGFMYQKDSFVHYPEEHLLKSFGYDPTQIWKPWSVYVGRILILISWITFFVAISCFFGLFYLKSNQNVQTFPHGQN